MPSPAGFCPRAVVWWTLLQGIIRSLKYSPWSSASEKEIDSLAAWLILTLGRPDDFTYFRPTWVTGCNEFLFFLRVRHLPWCAVMWFFFRVVWWHFFGFENILHHPWLHHNFITPRHYCLDCRLVVLRPLSVVYVTPKTLHEHTGKPYREMQIL